MTRVAARLAVAALCMVTWPAQSHSQTGEDQVLWRAWTGRVSGEALAITRDGRIYACRRRTQMLLEPDGALRWLKEKKDIPMFFAPPAIGADGTIYVGAGGTSSDATFLLALDGEGVEKWRTPLMAAGGSGMWVCVGTAIGSDGTLYVASYGDSTLYAVDPTGTLRWRLRLPRELLHAFVGPDETIYVLGNHGIHGVRADGTPEWEFAAGQFLQDPIVGTGGEIYVLRSRYRLLPEGWELMSDPASLLALDKDGSLMWQVDLPEGYRGGGAVLDEEGNILFTARATDAAGSIYSVAPWGEVLWRKEAEGPWSWGSYMVAGDNDAVYVIGGADGEQAVIALDVMDGWELWRTPVGTCGARDVTMGADGTLYVPCGEHLLAIDSGASGPAHSAWPMRYADPQNTARSPGAITAVVEVSGSRPQRFELRPAYPNPFNASAAIRYELATPGRARLVVYDVAGQRVEVLVDEEHGAGTHETVWDAEGRASGVYLVELRVGPEREVERVALVR